MLDLIKVFEQVVLSSSFSQAGKVLCMAPSSVARNIDSLESLLKTTLFKRSTRQLVLTEAGQYFYQQAVIILQQSDQLIAEMQATNCSAQGMLRISVFESFGNLYLTPLIPEFLARYPKIQIELDLDNNIVDLHSDKIDIAIRIGTPQDSSLKARHLLSNHTSLVASPDYIAQFGAPAKPEDLQQHNCLLISHERQRNYWYFCKKQQHKKVSVTGNLISKGGSPLLTAALQGCGVLLLSNWMLKPYLGQGQLIRLLPQWCITHNEHSSGEIFAIYKGSQFPQPHIRVFIDFLVEKLALTELAESEESMCLKLKVDSNC